jgi:hypothetical protein
MSVIPQTPRAAGGLGPRKRNFFPHKLTLGYMTKTLDQIFFYSSTKIRIFFQQHWESEYFFRKKT